MNFGRLASLFKPITHSRSLNPSTGRRFYSKMAAQFVGKWELVASENMKEALMCLETPEDQLAHACKVYAVGANPPQTEEISLAGDKLTHIATAGGKATTTTLTLGADPVEDVNSLDGTSCKTHMYMDGNTLLVMKEGATWSTMYQVSIVNGQLVTKMTPNPATPGVVCTRVYKKV